ncbi:MAG: galactose-1-phosphate uridylyltransferase [Clostridiales bacterium]|jgi:UDPglucose--hexose-1-phosphate uridylyltransferase|nr:galactose-1-phosphate uridylyltransferase [Clostridiales bacterium]
MDCIKSAEKIDAAVNGLTYYAGKHLGLKSSDKIYARNILLDILGLPAINDCAVDTAFIDGLPVPDVILEPFGEFALEKGLTDEAGLDNFLTKIMGAVTPAPSIIERKFRSVRNKNGALAACDYLYDLSVHNNYIRKSAIDKNIIWRAEKENLIITVNLSKPEKSNAEIARLLAAPVSNYPKCALCEENLGFAGTPRSPARQNIRTVPLKLGGEDWFFQFSPYVYYNRHCIAVNREHTPMTVDSATTEKLLDFVDYIPGYFIGSNASLPLIGGSILNHEHYQGGYFDLPVFGAPVRDKRGFDGVTVEVLDWYNNAVRLRTSDRDAMRSAGERFIKFWAEYTDADAGVLAYTDKPHNSCSPICRKIGGEYLLDFIFRNNRTDERYPEGIFHAHPEYFHIKREGIGLIEAMGLFILPGRLSTELKTVEDALTGALKNIGSERDNKHYGMVEELTASFGTANAPETARRLVREYINRTCRKILECTAVFKAGTDGFDKFLAAAGVK